MNWRDLAWKRSPRGKIFGVVTGLAEWRELDPNTTRLIVGIIAFCTMPLSIIVYLVLALVLPMDHSGSYTRHDRSTTGGIWENSTDDFRKNMDNMKKSYNNHRKSSKQDVEDAKWEERSTDDIRAEYEELKRKVENMESEMFDKEKDWDARFKDSEDK